MTDLALSALTDTILACEIFFLAGLSFRAGLAARSAAGVWAVTLFLMGTATLLGAIDHGYFESIGHPAHAGLVIATRVTVALASLVMLMSTAKQFLPGPWGLAVTGIGVLGFAATAWVVAVLDNFLVVIANYSVVLIFALILHLLGLRSGRGSLAMCAGIVLTIAASLLVPLGIEGPSWLGLYGTYHVALMPAVFFLYLGGRHLDRTA